MIYYRTRHLVKKNNVFYVCLPVRLLRSLGWKAGDEVLIWKDEESELHIRSENYNAKVLQESDEVVPTEDSRLIFP